MTLYEITKLAIAAVLGICGVVLAGMAIWRDRPRLVLNAAACWLMCFAVVLSLWGDTP